MLISIIGVVFLFSIIILVHEFGHFWTAKRAGIRVETFSLGFGPKLFSWRRGETLYQLCLLPFGGFVKMSGEEYHEKRQFEPWEYMGKAPGLRAQVLVAGSLHNLLFGLILLVPIFMMGVPGYDGTKIGSFVKGLPAETSGLKIGDEVLEINGTKCRNWFDVSRNIKAATAENGAGPVAVTVRRAGEVITFQVMPKPKETEDMTGKKVLARLIGIGPMEVEEKYGFFPAFVRAGKEFGTMVYGVFLALKMLFTNEVSAKYLTGPVGIAQWGAEIAHSGIAKYLYFMSFISVNLGLFNLLPVPILDGGHLVGLLVERITRKRPSRKLLEIIQYAGLAALVFLILFVTYNDVLRILEAKLKK